MKGKITLAIFGGLFAIAAITAISFGVRWFMAPAKGKLNMREQVYSADHRRQAYEHFYDLCASVKRKQTSLIAQQQRLKNAESRLERRRVRSNIAGLKAELRSAIEQYNVDVRKKETQAKFLGKDLPSNIDYKQAKKGKGVVCTKPSAKF